MWIVRFLFFAFGFLVGPLVLSSDSSSSPSYFDSLLDEEETEVDCSNILDFISSYFNLSEKNQSLLGVSASRFLSEIRNEGGKNEKEKKRLIEDISESVYLIQDNQYILSDKSSIIMEVLPDCLKK